MPSMSELMKQAQEMQSKLQDAQKELADIIVVGESGAGLVKVHMSGRHYAQRVEVDPSVFDDEDVETLEDLIAAAINSAVDRVEKESRKQMEKLTKDLNLPTDLELPKGEGGDTGGNE